MKGRVSMPDKLKEMLTVSNVFKLVGIVALVISTYFVSVMTQNNEIADQNIRGVLRLEINF